MTCGANDRDRTDDLALRSHLFFVYSRGLDCIFSLFYERTLVSRSGDKNFYRHGLAQHHFLSQIFGIKSGAGY